MIAQEEAYAKTIFGVSFLGKPCQKTPTIIVYAQGKTNGVLFGHKRIQLSCRKLKSSAPPPAILDNAAVGQLYNFLNIEQIFAFVLYGT